MARPAPSYFTSNELMDHDAELSARVEAGGLTPQSWERATKEARSLAAFRERCEEYYARPEVRLSIMNMIRGAD
jgi:predicted RNA-binding protein associated with RNAse of E/G family